MMTGPTDMHAARTRTRRPAKADPIAPRSTATSGSMSAEAAVATSPGFSTATATATAALTLDVATYASPIGPLGLAARGDALVALHLPESDQLAPSGRAAPAPTPILARAMRQLGEYFAGTRTRFDLTLSLADGTPFQQAVWRALCDVPYGATCNYGAIATAIGRPSASRAVGMANHRNPIAIIVPCHRVIGASGALTGYGGGLPTKQFLLDLERGQRGLAL